LVGTGSSFIERDSFRLRLRPTAGADDENVSIEKPEGGGQHAAEVRDGEQRQRNSNDSVEYRHYHAGSSLRRYVPVTYTVHTIPINHPSAVWNQLSLARQVGRHNYCFLGDGAINQLLPHIVFDEGGRKNKFGDSCIS